MINKGMIIYLLVTVSNCHTTKINFCSRTIQNYMYSVTCRSVMQGNAIQQYPASSRLMYIQVTETNGTVMRFLQLVKIQ